MFKESRNLQVALHISNYCIALLQDLNVRALYFSPFLFLASAQNDSNSAYMVSSRNVFKIYALPHPCRDWQYSWNIEIVYFVAILVFLAHLLVKTSFFCSSLRTTKRLPSPSSVILHMSTHVYIVNYSQYCILFWNTLYRKNVAVHLD